MCHSPKKAAGDDGGEKEEAVVVKIPTYWEMATARDSGTALGTLALLCPAWITYQELFPLFCSASPETGGIGFTAYQIGTAMTISGLVMVVYQPLVFPRLQRHFGNVRCYRYGTISFNLLLIAFPWSHFLWDQGACELYFLECSKHVKNAEFAPDSAFLDRSIRRKRTQKMTKGWLLWAWICFQRLWEVATATAM